MTRQGVCLAELSTRKECDIRIQRISAVIATAAIAVTVLVAGVVSPAMADPNPTNPFPAYAGTGSDTTQDVVNDLANGGTLVDVGSWNAFGTATIQVKAGGPSFTRPAGSGNGIKALSASIQGLAYGGATASSFAGQLDFARSSRGPKVTGSALTFVPLARDAVSYVSNSTALASLTTAQLTQVYKANAAADLVVTVAGNPITVQPVLPPAGSGTRDFFLGAISVPAASVGSLVTQGGPENDGAGLTAVNSIAPFSAAAWIAQKNAKSTDTTGTLSLGAIDGVVPATLAGTWAPNPAYYASTTFGRDVYNVIATSRLVANSASDQGFITDFAGPNAIVRSAAAQSVITANGFQAVPYAGDTDLPGTDVTGYIKALAGAFE